jgi:hypothetical protein
VGQGTTRAVGDVERLGTGAVQRVSGAVQSVRNLNGGRKKTRKNKRKHMKKRGGAGQQVRVLAPASDIVVKN